MFNDSFDLSSDFAEQIRKSVSTDIVDLPNSPFDIEEIFNSLKHRIESFQSQLADDENVIVQLANFGASKSILVKNITYSPPSLIIFRGVDEDNNFCELIQNASQLNFLLVSKKSTSIKQRIQIGFSLPKD